MPHAALSAAVARATRSVAPAGPEANDGELLSRFLATRDEEAFAELVRRIGPMVLGLCRRVAGEHHLADDAFQAAFLVLARRAADVRPREAVRGWLYGVAVRVAQKARTMSARRRHRETPVSCVPDRAGQSAVPPDADALRILDEEVAALPDHLRAAVVVCELDGVGRRAAAARLGIRQGTLSSRLAKARKLLADRLRKRGVVMPAAGLAALGGATVSARLASATSVLATSAGPVPPGIAALTTGVFRTMLLQKLSAVVLLLLGAVGLAVTAAEPPTPIATKHPLATVPVITHPKPAPPPAKPAGPNRILFDRAGQLTLIDPDGKNEKRVDEELAKSLAQNGRLSPDGKKIAFLVVPEPPGDAPGRHFLSDFRLTVRDVDGKGSGTELGSAKAFAWSPDGTEIAATDFTATDGLPDKIKPEATHFVVNVETKERTALKLPDDHIITDWSRDGKYFVTTQLKGTKDAPAARVFLMNRDGTEHKTVTDGKAVAMGGMLSPDGRRILYTEIELPKDKPPVPRKLVLADVATGATAPVEGLPLDAELQSYCWSPDGKRIAYSWGRTINPGTTQEETEAYLVVCDPDGKNEKTVVSEKHPTRIGTLLHVDWR